MSKFVKSNTVFTPQTFLETVTGTCYLLDGKEGEVRDILDKAGYDNLWDYPLDEIDHIVENNLSVVLVDTTYIANNDDGDVIQVPEYRWFQVPEDWKEDVE